MVVGRFDSYPGRERQLTPAMALVSIAKRPREVGIRTVRRVAYS